MDICLNNLFTFFLNAKFGNLFPVINHLINVVAPSFDEIYLNGLFALTVITFYVKWYSECKRRHFAPNINKLGQYENDLPGTMVNIKNGRDTCSVVHCSTLQI